MRRAAKKDRNHPEIVKALRKAGCQVLDLGAVGNGCPDLLVCLHGVMVLLEVKDGTKPPSERVLTKPQVDFHEKWGACVETVYSVDDAMRAAGAYFV